MRLENTIIYLVGHTGVGKLTTARQLCARTGAKLVDNHLINNPVFSIIGADGTTPIPRPAWDNIHAIRDIVLASVRELSPPEFSFVLTNVLFDDEEDLGVYRKVEGVAAARNSLFVPIILECAEDELLRRVRTPERAERHKVVDVESARKRLRERPLLPIEHANLLRLDTTHLAAEASAGAILGHIAGLA